MLLLLGGGGAYEVGHGHQTDPYSVTSSGACELPFAQYGQYGSMAR